MKTKLIHLLIVGFIASFLGACQALNKTSGDNPESTPTLQSFTKSTSENGNIVIQTNSFSGVILTKEIISKSIVGNQEYWTPSVEQILTLESQIEKFLSDNAQEFHSGKAPVGETLLKYNRQYYGVLDKEAHIIIGFYFCSTMWADGGWKKGLVDARGGGNCFFHVEYNADENVLYNIWVNATR